MRFQTLEDWLRWQEQLHPKNIDLGLERVAEVWRRLCPEGLACTVITIGGTNGKGSCVAFLDAILRAAGYRSACYTSPHIRRYNERVRINGQEAGDQALCEAFERVDQARRGVSLTYFEFATLAALDLFSRAGLDVAILEVGLGGRLDAVNVLDADAMMVCSVDLDHTDWLGGTLAAIAREKAGIFRPGRPAIIAQADAPGALEAAALDIGAEVFLAGRDFYPEQEAGQWRWIGPGSQRFGLPTPALRARHQLANAAAVLMLLECLSERLPVDQRAVRSGLQQVRLDGRLQVIPGEITWLLDVAHNPAAAVNLAQDLSQMPATGACHAVFGCFADKDAKAMLQALSGVVSRWYFAAPDSDRALPADKLQSMIQELDAKAVAQAYPSISAAIEAASQSASPGDRILLTGSFLTVAAALRDPLLTQGDSLGIIAL